MNPKFKVGDLVMTREGNSRFSGFVAMSGTDCDGEWWYGVVASNPAFRNVCMPFRGDELQRRSVQSVMHGQVAA